MAQAKPIQAAGEFAYGRVSGADVDFQLSSSALEVIVAVTGGTVTAREAVQTTPHGTNLEIAVTRAGTYLVIVTGTVKQLDNAGQNYTFALYETLGAASAAAVAGCQCKVEAGAVTDYTGFSLCAVVNLNATDNVELWGRTETTDNTDMLMDINFVVVRIR